MPELRNASIECQSFGVPPSSARASVCLYGMLGDKAKDASSERRKLLCRYRRYRPFDVSRAFACRVVCVRDSVAR